MTLPADRLHARWCEKAAVGVAVGRVNRVTADAANVDRVMVPDRVKCRRTPTFLLRVGAVHGLCRGRIARDGRAGGRRGRRRRLPTAQNRRVALPALAIPEWQAHVGGLGVCPGEEFHRIEPGDGPDAEPHDRIGAAMARNAPDRAVLRVMVAGQVGRRAGDETFVFPVVQMAGDAETIITLLRRQPGQEECAQPDATDGGHRDGQPQSADGRAGDGSLAVASTNRQRDGLGEEDPPRVAEVTPLRQFATRRGLDSSAGGGLFGAVEHHGGDGVRPRLLRCA